MVAVYDVLADQEPPVIVMEYVAGGSLEERLASKRLPPDEALRIAGEVLAGLERIHQAGIVHRDLKPANILLDADGTAKVTDFGIAHPPENLAQVATLAGSSVGQPGSLAYMSPEQARGEALDARSDLYAVGVLLYRMLTGEHYLDLQGSGAFKVRQLLQEAPPRLPAPLIPAPIEAVLRRALEKDPARRHASAAEMARAIASVAVPRKATVP